MPIVAAAQFTRTAQGAREDALGGCLFVPGEASRYRVEAGLRQGYLMPEMSTRYLSARAALGERATAGAEYSYFGDAVYNEQQVAVAAALRAIGWLDVGVRLRYLYLGTADAWYEAERYVAADAHATATVGGAVRLSALAGMRPWDDRWPLRLAAEVAYRAAEGLLVVVGAERDDRPRLRGGAEYTYRHRLAFRAGLHSAPVALGFGIGWRQPPYSIDIAVEAHSVLGLNPQITFGLCL